MNNLESAMTAMSSLGKEIQEGISFAKAFVQLREKRIAVLEERLQKQQHELELWRAIAEELARQQAFQLNNPSHTDK